MGCGQGGLVGGSGEWWTRGNLLESHAVDELLGNIIVFKCDDGPGGSERQFVSMMLDMCTIKDLQSRKLLKYGFNPDLEQRELASLRAYCAARYIGLPEIGLVKHKAGL